MSYKSIFKRVIIEHQQMALPELVQREMYFPVLKTNKIISVIGPRRSGKTYFLYQLMKELLEKGVERKKILYVNLEDPRLFPLDKDALNMLFESYFELFPELVNEQIYVFLDEVQNAEMWDLFVRHIYEQRKYRVFISGSSSKMLSKEIATVLRGRTLPHIILPFSFTEFLSSKGVKLNETSIYGTERFKIKKYFYEYLKFGGFPEIALERDENIKQRILQEYLNVMICRDVVERYAIRNLILLRYMIKFLMTNVSNKFSISSFHRLIKSRYSVSKATITEYISYLEDIMLVFLVEPYVYSLKVRLQLPRKLYVVDNGLRNANSFLFSEDYGRLAENVVFLQLFRRTLREPKTEIYYWTGKKQEEIDFVVVQNDQVSELYQVCWDISNEKTREREEKSLLKGLDEFNLESGYILTEDYSGEKKVNGKTIKYIPIWMWLLT
ncbi:MAG: ATP-binding protein [Candidatus Asgardarchaeia archaeon]